MRNLLHNSIVALLVLIKTICGSCNSPSQGSHTSSLLDEDTVTIVSAPPNPLERWEAGAKIDSILVMDYGLERCFAVEEISDSVFALMQGKSYHSGVSVPRQELRYIKVLHYTANDEIRIGELVANKSIAYDLKDIFYNLYKSHYPIEKITLIDNYDGSDEASMRDNNTSCYNHRKIEGGSRLSLHAQGRAIDINPLFNPYVRTVEGVITKVAPTTALEYADRKDNQYKINYGDDCHTQFLKHGFNWGGSWKHSVKDYQHFQK